MQGADIGLPLHGFQRGYWVYRRTVTSLIAGLGLLLAGLLSVPAASAQSTIDGEMHSYGYFSSDVSTSFTVIHLEPNTATLAGEMVSPQYADDFFSGFTIFTNYEFASDLDPKFIDQIDEADEYMVFSGDFDSYDGVKPGYTILLSSSQQVFLFVGYQADAEDLFGLAEQTIADKEPPAEFGDYTRMDLDNVSGSDNGEDTGVEFCYVEPAFALMDENGDERITIAEFEEWSDTIPEVGQMIDTMEANGYDSIRYVGC